MMLRLLRRSASSEGIESLSRIPVLPVMLNESCKIIILKIWKNQFLSIDILALDLNSDLSHEFLPIANIR